MHITLEGRVALISGGTGGIGVATAELMREAGAKVVLADVASEGEEIARRIGARYLSLDVTSEAAWASAVAEIERCFGELHILVNAAGIEGDQKDNSVLSTSLADWRRVHAVNLDGTFLGCRAVLPLMQRHRLGAIVNISSVASCLPRPTNCAYGSSKAAVAHLTKSVAAWGTLNGSRIRCNSVHPGLIRTRMLYSIVSQKFDGPVDAAEAAEAQAHDTVPLGSLVEPEEVARQIVYLASDAAANITGSEFRIDGGWSLALGGWQRR